MSGGTPPLHGRGARGSPLQKVKSMTRGNDSWQRTRKHIGHLTASSSNRAAMITNASRHLDDAKKSVLLAQLEASTTLQRTASDVEDVVAAVDRLVAARRTVAEQIVRERLAEEMVRAGCGEERGREEFGWRCGSLFSQEAEESKLQTIVDSHVHRTLGPVNVRIAALETTVARDSDRDYCCGVLLRGLGLVYSGWGRTYVCMGRCVEGCCGRVRCCGGDGGKEHSAASPVAGTAEKSGGARLVLGTAARPVVAGGPEDEMEGPGEAVADGASGLGALPQPLQVPLSTSSAATMYSWPGSAASASVGFFADAPEDGRMAAQPMPMRMRRRTQAGPVGGGGGGGGVGGGWS
jgi:hypothetical protein